MSNTKARLDFIDMAKGIGIILVIIGHLDTNTQFSRYLIYAFHMPLFFLLSGVFSNTKTSFKEYFCKAFKTLYIPYATCIIFDIVIIGLIKFINHDKELLTFIKNDFLALFGINFSAFNRAIWFLFALFIIRIIYYFIDKHIIFKAATIILGIGFVFISTKINMIDNLLYLILIPGLVFYTIGDLCSEFIKNIQKTMSISKGLSVLIYEVITLLFIFLTSKNECIDMTWYTYGNPALYYVNSLLGIISFLGFITITLWICNNKLRFIKDFAIYLGKNSIYIMITHYYFARRLFPFIIRKVGLKEYCYTYPMQAILLVIIVIISIDLIWVFNNWLYFIFGKAKPNKTKKA